MSFWQALILCWLQLQLNLKNLPYCSCNTQIGNEKLSSISPLWNINEQQASCLFILAQLTLIQGPIRTVRCGSRYPFPNFYCKRFTINVWIAGLSVNNRIHIRKNKLLKKDILNLKWNQQIKPCHYFNCFQLAAFMIDMIKTK